MKRKFQSLVFLVLLLPVSLKSESVLFTFSPLAYIPFSAIHGDENIKLVGLRTGKNILPALKKNGYPEVLLFSLRSGLKLLRKVDGVGYHPLYVVMWRSGHLYLPASNTSPPVLYAGCRDHLSFLRFYKQKIKGDFMVRFNPYPLILNRALGGEQIGFVLIEPFGSLLLSKMPGVYIPFLSPEEFVMKFAHLKFPVEGLPLGAIFIKKGSKEKVKNLLERFVKIAGDLNRHAERYSRLISEGFRKFFKMNIPPVVIEDSLNSGRVYFYPVKYEKISSEVVKYLNFISRF